MPSAILDTSLVDDLVSTVDGLRSELLPAFGVRALRVFLVTRTWSGTERGAGTATDVETEVDPPPLINLGAPGTPEEHYELKSHGRDPEGGAQASEISLRYTEAELTGGAIAANVEFFWRAIDAHGQQQTVRYFVPSAPPRVDREKSIGWVVTLKRVDER